MTTLPTLRTRALLYLGWLVLASYLVSQHVMWRDEMRAMSLVLQGDDVFGMLRAIHGEGHPALWYLMLRAAHAVVPSLLVLPGVAFLVGAAGAALVAFRAPFRARTIALVLFGGFMLFEYTVMARNYGIAMLCLFAIADRYRACRERGMTLGVLVFLLCNTNAPAVLFAGGFMLFWLIDLVAEHGVRDHPAFRWFAVNAGIALLGVVACVLVIYPPFNDAAVSPRSAGIGILGVLQAAVGVAVALPDLVPPLLWSVPGMAVLAAIVIALAPFGLIRAPAAFVAAIVVLPVLLLFFQLVYPGSYRHEALFLVFLLSLHWMVAKGAGGRWPGTGRRVSPGTPAMLERIGVAAFTLLLALQVVTSAAIVAEAVRGIPATRARDLGRLLQRPDLRRAIVIANPDFMLEALPYYSPNPIYFVREQRFGHVVHFTRASAVDRTLADTIATARALRRRYRRPVVIAMRIPLDLIQSHTVQDSYIGSFSTTPQMVRDFLRATTPIARFGPAGTDESYDVYLLTPN